MPTFIPPMRAPLLTLLASRTAYRRQCRIVLLALLVGREGSFSRGEEAEGAKQPQPVTLARALQVQELSRGGEPFAAISVSGKPRCWLRAG